jgi:uncharacterized protein (DUF2237 family)
MSDAEEDTTESEQNVLGTPLSACGTDPMTGYLRDGKCRHLRRDPGRHEVCAVLSDAFLQFAKAHGNDLVTPRPEFDFPGLIAGDAWCLCLPRWVEAREAGVAPPVVLEATSEAVLDTLSVEELRKHKFKS